MAFPVSPIDRQEHNKYIYIESKGAWILNTERRTIYPSNQGLLAHYKLDEGTGIGDPISVFDLETDSLDTSGKGNHGIDTDVAYLDGAAVFNGTSSIVLFNGTEKDYGEFSVSFWFKYDEEITVNTTFIHSNMLYLVSTSSSGGIGFSVWCDTGPGWDQYSYFSENEIITDDDKWHNIVITYDGVISSYGYLDGELIASKTDFPFSLYLEGDGISSIGGSTDGGQPFNGSIKQFNSFGRVLSDDEIKQLYLKPDNSNNLELNMPYSPVAEWKLDGSPLDSSGNGFHGDGNGTDLSYTQGRRDNQAAIFNGTDDYINTTGLMISPAVNALSYSVWFNWDGSGGGSAGRYFIFESKPNYTFGLSIEATGFLRVFSLLETNVIIATTAVTIETDTWYNATVVYERMSEFKIYLDGVDITASPPTLYDQDLSSYDGINIGTYRGADDRWFSGMISDLTFYDRLLNEQEILQLAESTHPIKDSSGNNKNGYSIKPLNWVNGVSGKGVKFNFDNKIELPVRTKGVAATWSYWMKDSNSTARILLSQGVFSVGGVYFQRDLDSDDIIFVFNSNGDYEAVYVPVTTDELHFIVVTLDTLDVKIYVDSILVHEVTLEITPLLGTYDLSLGDYTNTGYISNDTIDDIRIYERALSSKEVRGLYKYK